MIDGWFVWKSPGKGVIMIEKLGKARNENGEENRPVNKLHELIVRICINYNNNNNNNNIPSEWMYWQVSNRAMFKIW